VSSKRLMAWLELGRVANLPSALANVWMGMLIATGGWLPVWQWLLLSLASAALYTAGMVLNDWWDVEQDQRERPERPLPSGRIKTNTAGWAGFLLLGCGVGLAGCAGVLASSMTWRPLAIAGLLAIAILLYDIVLKRTVAAPWVMGACRGLNVLLGASPALTLGGWSGFAPPVLGLAACLTVYVAGITWLARSEAGVVRRGPLVLGSVLIGLALAGYVWVVQSAEFLQMVGGARQVGLYPLLILAIGFPILKRAWRAIGNLQPRTVQGAVVTALRSMVFLDASVCIIAGQGSLLYGLAVLALLPVGLLLNSVSRHT
jgi:4-hydroxybenzoate polyprenyltransferase